MDNFIQNLRRRRQLFINLHEVFTGDNAMWVEQRIASLTDEINQELELNGDQEQTVNVYWNKPLELERVANFRILQAVPANESNVHDIDQALEFIVNDIAPTIVDICEELKCMKVWLSLHVRYESANPLAEQFLFGDAHLKAPHSIFYSCQPDTNAPYKVQMDRFANVMKNSNAKFISEQSGYILAEIYSLNINIVQFNPLSGSGWSKLPKFLKTKRQ